MDRSVAVLFGGNLQKTAFQNIFSGKSAFDMAVEAVLRFPSTQKVVLLTNKRTAGRAFASSGGHISNIEIIIEEVWTKKTLLAALARVSVGFDVAYFAWADTPFLDVDVAAALADRHSRYGADYSFADGYPLGLAPELVSPSCAARLADLPFEDGVVGRDALFSVIQTDINGFDIETEIAPFDLRSRRLCLAADSKRNLLLLQRLFETGFSGAGDSLRLVNDKPELFRTLPAFYPVQVAPSCTQSCAICPYPASALYGKGDFLDPSVFECLLDKIIAFSGDAALDLSLWGELSLHPRKAELIGMALDRPGLSLIIETSGVGWSAAELEALAERAAIAAPRENALLPALSWIVSLDAHDPERYRQVRGAGFAEAVETVKRLAALFPKNAYVQAVRVAGAEDDIERFYRYWKAESAAGGSVPGIQIIIQKYNNFCASMSDLRVGDLSPVERQPCWHLMRDMPVLLDGAVPLCRESIASAGNNSTLLGNAFTDDLEEIWARGEGVYMRHAAACGAAYRSDSADYPELCARCDEYYTFNI